MLISVTTTKSRYDKTCCLFVVFYFPTITTVVFYLCAPPLLFLKGLQATVHFSAVRTVSSCLHSTQPAHARHSPRSRNSAPSTISAVVFYLCVVRPPTSPTFTQRCYFSKDFKLLLFISAQCAPSRLVLPSLNTAHAPHSPHSRTPFHHLLCCSIPTTTSVVVYTHHYVCCSVYPPLRLL